MLLDLQPDVEQALKERLEAGVDLNQLIRQALHKSTQEPKPVRRKGVGLSGRPWSEIFAGLSPVSDDFMANRRDLPLQERALFDK